MSNLFFIPGFQSVHQQLLAEHQKSSESLKATMADNKVLIAQHQEVVQRHQKQQEANLASQDKILEDARRAMLKEVQREKGKAQILQSEGWAMNQRLTCRSFLPRVGHQ